MHRLVYQAVFFGAFCQALGEPVKRFPFLVSLSNHIALRQAQGVRLAKLIAGQRLFGDDADVAVKILHVLSLIVCVPASPVHTGWLKFPLGSVVLLRVGVI